MRVTKDELIEATKKALKSALTADEITKRLEEVDRTEEDTVIEITIGELEDYMSYLLDLVLE